jgi:hypothetical protein
MAARTIAQLKANMPIGTTAGTSVQDIHDIVDTFDSRTTVSVMDFGATGTGDANDDTAAIQAAINTGRPVYFPKPPNFYKITATLDCRANDGQKFFGLDSTETEIKMTGATLADVNKPIFWFGGRRKQLSGLYLTYWPQPTAAQTDAVAIKTDNLMWSVIEDINIYSCAVGIGIGQSGFTGNGGTMNWLFSCTIRDIFIGNVTLHGMYLSTVGSTSTGNVIQNIYINGYNDVVINDVRQKNTIQHGVYMEEHDSTALDTVNVEHVRFTVAGFAAITVRALAARAIHMEGVVPAAANAVIGSFSNGKATVIGWDVIWSQFLAANTTKTALVQVAQNHDLTVFNFVERDNTVDAGANATIVYSWETFVNGHSSSIRLPSSTFLTIPTIGTLLGTPTRPVVRQVGERHFYPTQAIVSDAAFPAGELYVDTAAANVIKRKP